MQTAPKTRQHMPSAILLLVSAGASSLVSIPSPASIAPMPPTKRSMSVQELLFGEWTKSCVWRRRHPEAMEKSAHSTTIAGDAVLVRRHGTLPKRRCRLHRGRNRRRPSPATETPRRSGRADFPHPAPRPTDSLRALVPGFDARGWQWVDLPELIEALPRQRFLLTSPVERLAPQSPDNMSEA